MKEEKYVRFCLAKHVAVSVSFSSFHSLAFLFLGAWKWNHVAASMDALYLAGFLKGCITGLLVHAISEEAKGQKKKRHGEEKNE